MKDDDEYGWTKCFSKTYQTEYWFNVFTGAKSWSSLGGDPEKKMAPFYSISTTTPLSSTEDTIDAPMEDTIDALAKTSFETTDFTERSSVTSMPLSVSTKPSSSFDFTELRSVTSKDDLEFSMPQSGSENPSHA